MTWLWPFMLSLLALVPILLVVYILMQRRRQRYALRYASLPLLKQAVGRGPGFRRHIPPALFLLSLAVMIIALARPVAEAKVPGYDGQIVLAIDVSGSMQADDLKPTRLSAAQEAAQAFVAQQPGGVRIGVVAFNSDAALVQAPTTDFEAVDAAINRLDAQGGTAIGDGMITAMKALAERNTANAAAAGAANAAPSSGSNAGVASDGSGGIIVLLSDGENNDGYDPIRIANTAKANGIRVFTVGIGTPNGTVLKIEGRSMRVRLDQDTLRRVADITGARYFNAATESDLQSIYENMTLQFGLHTERTEVTALVTGLAAVLALAGGTLSLLWFSRLP